MKMTSWRKRVGAVLAVAWVASVIGCYLFYNRAYYAEKFRTFVPFFARVLK